MIYIVKCKIHPDDWYVGSTKNLKLRWANHKSDVKLQKIHKCNVAKHVWATPHPISENWEFLQIMAIDTVEDEEKLLERKTYWACNLGTIFQGLNTRQEIRTIRKKYKYYNS